MKRALFYTVQGVPTWVIDGKATMGGGDRAGTKRVYDRINPDIEKELGLPTEAHVTVDGIKGDSKELRLQIARWSSNVRLVRRTPSSARADAPVGPPCPAR